MLRVSKRIVLAGTFVVSSLCALGTASAMEYQLGGCDFMIRNTSCGCTVGSCRMEGGQLICDLSCKSRDGGVLV